MSESPYPPQNGTQPHPGAPPPPQHRPMQPPQPGPGHPGQQPPVRPPDATLLLTVQGHALTSSFVPPTITIDGHPAPSTNAGTVTIPIVSGRHRVEASAQWLRRYGQASLDVDIAPHSTVQVYYAPPFHQFTDGAMGVTPQTRKGVGVMIGCLAVPLGVALLVVIIVLIVGLAG